jgi:hypothetical protein
MAKFEFSAAEIAVLKKAAAEAQKAAAEKAKAIIEESGIEFTVSPEIKATLTAPEAGTVGDNKCYACFTCLVVGAATLALAWVNY